MKRIGLIGVVLAVACYSALAAGNKTPPTGHESVEPFDLTVSALPPQFKGNSPVDMYFALAKTPPLKKGEFETTAQFDQRQSEINKRPFLGSLSRQDVVSISLSPSESGVNSKLSFDADASRMTLALSTGYFPRGCSMRIANTSKAVGSYIGANAFGAKAKVTKHEVAYLCLGGIRDTKVTFPMGREKAAEIKHRLKVLLIGNLAPPYASEEEDYSSPTVSNPAEIIYRAYILNLNVEQIWVYDPVTGEVVHKPGLDLSGAYPPGVEHPPVGAVDQNENNLIHQAIWTERYATAEAYIKTGRVNVNGRNKFGATPLHIAVWKRQPQLVSALLSAGADKMLQDYSAKTPLDDAIDRGFPEIASLLR